MEDSISQLSDSLTCPICLELAKRPVFTSCCAKVICSQCLNRWQELHTSCPICRSNSSAESHHMLSFGDQLTSLISILSISPESFSPCPTHNKKLDYFCQNCRTFLCSDCLFEIISKKEHQNHVILQAEIALHPIRLQLKKQLMLLLVDLNKIQTQIVAVKENSKQLQDEHLSIQREVYSSFRKIETRVQTTLESIGGTRPQYINDLKTLIHKLSDLKSQIESTLRLGEVEMLVKAQEMHEKNGVLQQVDQIKTEIPTCLRKIPGIFPKNEFVPEQEKVSYLLENYVQVRNDCMESHIYTENFNLCGNKWKLKIYPNGTANGQNTFLSLFVELIKGPPGESNYYYRVEIPSPNRNRMPFIRKYNSPFAPTSSWGWNRMAPIDELIENYLDDDGHLHIDLYIVPDSFYQVYKSHQHQIQHYKDKIDQLQG